MFKPHFLLQGLLLLHQGIYTLLHLILPSFHFSQLGGLPFCQAFYLLTLFVQLLHKQSHLFLHANRGTSTYAHHKQYPTSDTSVAFAEVNTYSGHKCSDSMIAQDRTHDAVQRSHL